MIPIDLGTVFALLLWGTLSGLDLVTAPQALLSRPLVAGAGAGVLLGDPLAGLQVGVVLELFALDVLPVGASRYPDFAAGTIGAVVLVHQHPPALVLGVATFLGLTLAVLGGWSLQLMRQAIGQRVQQATAGLAAGDAGVITGLQYRGVLLDTTRSAVLALLAVTVAIILRPHLPEAPRFVLVTAVAIGAGLSAAVAGAIRSTGSNVRLRWLTIGGGVGLLAAVLQ